MWVDYWKKNNKFRCGKCSLVDRMVERTLHPNRFTKMFARRTQCSRCISCSSLRPQTVEMQHVGCRMSSARCWARVDSGICGMYAEYNYENKPWTVHEDKPAATAWSGVKFGSFFDVLHSRQDYAELKVIISRCPLQHYPLLTIQQSVPSPKYW